MINKRMGFMLTHYNIIYNHKFLKGFVFHQIFIAFYATTAAG